MIYISDDKKEEEIEEQNIINIFEDKTSNNLI